MNALMRPVYLVLSLFFVLLASNKSEAQEGDLTRVARFQAASTILEKVTHNLTSFQYPQVNTTDLPEVLSPYSSLLAEITNAFRKSEKLSDRQQAEVAFFCGVGVLNLKNLVLREMRGLMLPQNPGDTPDALKKTHARAFGFFTEQAALTELIPELIQCDQYHPAR